MQKAVTAVITQGQELLLIHRAKNPKKTDYWELPVYQINQYEKMAKHLKQQLKTNLSIEAEIENMVTSLKTSDFELFAYTVKNFTGTISGVFQWVPVSEIHNQRMLPVDIEIIKRIYPDVKTKLMSRPNTTILPDNDESVQNLETKARIFASKQIKIPYYDEAIKQWCVVVIKNNKEEKKSFPLQKDAYSYYMGYIYQLMAAFKKNYLNSLVQKSYV
ncbi:MAG: hypothetical protein IKN73_04315 [Alphaproteobacteria bacterium]|nr:hypothetical protein [Alphaproteobacteria bacterium]